MKIKTRRSIRLVTMGLSLVSAATCGFIASHPVDNTNMAILALAITFSMLMALSVEALASDAERERELQTEVLSSLVSKAIEGDVNFEEKTRESERIFSMLTEQNSKFRGQLLSDRVREMDGIRRQRERDGSFPMDGPVE